MAYNSFKMPSNFRGFPSCPNCGHKNFTRKEQFYEGEDAGHAEKCEILYICDSCKMSFFEDELKFPNEEPTEEIKDELDPLHRHNKDWNSPSMKARVEQTCEEMKARGEKVIRVRRPDEL